MANITIFEGPRTVGKTTLSQKIRQKVWGSTLINFTGFKEDGHAGQQRVLTYYYSFLNAFREMDADVPIIADRIFISEMVYSRLYKSYDFEADFARLLMFLFHPKNTVNIFYLTASADEMTNRSTRDKAELFGSVKDEATELVRQADEYTVVMGMVSRFIENKKLTNVKLHTIDTTLMTPDEVYNTVLFNFN